MPIAVTTTKEAEAVEITAMPRWMKVVLFAFLAFLIGSLLVLNRLHPAGRPILKISGIDSVAYYAVAHSILYDHDLDLRNDYAALRPVPSPWNSVVPQTGLPASPFPLGFSLLELPFLALGRALESLFHLQADGFGRFSIFCYYLGNLCWLMAGLFCVCQLLRRVARALGATPREGDLLALAVPLALWPATTLGYFTFSSMSHVTAFFGCAAWLLIWWSAKNTVSIKRWALFGLLGGLDTLCRWQEALYLLLPISYELARIGSGARAATSPFPRWVASRVAAVAGFALAMAPQLYEWHCLYGSYFTVPQGDGFISLPPRHLLAVLLSRTHGWCVVTPIVLLGLLGLLIGLWRLPSLCRPIAVALTGQLLFQGSISSWHGYNFGMRMLTSAVIFLAVGFLVLLVGTSARRRVMVGLLCLLCTGWTLYQAARYRLDHVEHVDVAG